VKVKELLLDYKPVPTGSERFFLTQEVREDLSLCLQMLQRRKKRSGLGPNLIPRVFNKDPGMGWSHASPKFSTRGGVGKVISSYMLPMGYYTNINFANY
jgi:hypothetical protein